jgi:hypothetical protein
MNQVLGLQSFSMSQCGSVSCQLNIPTSQNVPTEPLLDLLNLLNNCRNAVLTLQDAYTDVCKLGQPKPIEMEFAEIIFIELDEVLGCSTVCSTVSNRLFGWQQMELQSSEPRQPVQMCDPVSAHQSSLQDHMSDGSGLDRHHSSKQDRQSRPIVETTVEVDSRVVDKIIVATSG